MYCRFGMVAHNGDDGWMSIHDHIDIPLSDEERALLLYGLRDWGGPAACTPAMARALGFHDVEDLFTQSDRMRSALRAHEPLTQRDWVRALLATEIVFASDVIGAGLDWSITTGLDDGQSIALLRSIQRKVPQARVRDALAKGDADT